MARTPRRRTKGTGQVFLKGRTWAIRYTENGSQRYAGGYATKDQATGALATITAEIRAGRPGIPKAPKVAPLFRDVEEAWLASRKTMRNHGDDANRWARELKPLLDHRRLDAVDDGLLESLGTGPSVERALYLLSSLYRWAARQGHVETNPVRKYLAGLGTAERKLLRSQHDPRDTPFIGSRAEVAAIFRKLPKPMNVAYALSALAGLRPGETIALEWSDIDFEKGRLTVRRQVRHGRVGPPKSGKPRDVDLVPGLAEMLRAWRQENPTALLVAPPVRSTRNEVTLRDGRTRAPQKYLGLASIQTALDDAFTKLKMKRLTFYESGRHTFASLWVLDGLDIYRLSKLMGHASVVTTQRYAHLIAKTPDAMLARADVSLAA